MQCVMGAQAVLLRQGGGGGNEQQQQHPLLYPWGSCSSLAIGETFVCLVPLCSACIVPTAAVGTLPAEDPLPSQ